MEARLNKLTKILQDKLSSGDFEIVSIKQQYDNYAIELQNDIQTLKITYWIQDNFIELDELIIK